MPIMRGKIQAILTTDAALLYGLGATLEIGGEEWKYGEKWTKQLQGGHCAIAPTSLFRDCVVGTLSVGTPTEAHNDCEHPITNEKQTEENLC